MGKIKSESADRYLNGRFNYRRKRVMFLGPNRTEHSRTYLKKELYFI